MIFNRPLGTSKTERHNNCKAKLKFSTYIMAGETTELAIISRTTHNNIMLIDFKLQRLA